MTDYTAGQTLTAWECIGFDQPGLYLRVAGGRALYEAAIYYDDTPGEHVKLVRLDTQDGVRQVQRYVDPDTILQVVAA